MPWRRGTADRGGVARSGVEPRHHLPLRHAGIRSVLQDVASFEETQETLALLKILALGNQDMAVGKVKPAADIVTRLRAKRRAA